MSHDKKVFSALPAVALCLMVGCAEMEENPETTGAVTGGAAGAVIGGVIGGNKTSTVLGAIAGGVLGKEIGRRMEENDRAKTAAAFDSNQKVSWTNPTTNARYTVNPITTRRENGQLCRDYVMDANITGETQQVTGTACQQPDGTWRTVEG